MSSDRDEQATPRQTTTDATAERRPWVVIVLLALIVVGVAVAGFVLLRNLDTTPDAAEEIASAVVGVWVTELEIDWTLRKAERIP